jgi:hypothetical protein
MRWMLALALAGCGVTHPDPGPGGDDPPPGMDPLPGDTIQVVLDNLQPGWRVTTTRSLDQAATTEDTWVSDGSPVTLSGGPTDVFVATVTDETGALIMKRAMKSPCTMASSRQLHVPSEYPTIQAAVDAAQPGETVKVAAGTYTESVTMHPGICLLGAGAKHTTLDAQGQPRTLVDLTAAPGAVVAGFTIRGSTQDSGCAQPQDPFACSGNWYHAGIYIGGEDWNDPTNDAPPIITDNVFASNDTGVMFYWRSQAILRNNVFVGNRLGFVANHFQDRALVANNVFVANTELAIGNQAAYLDIIDNIIVGSQTGIRFMYIQTGHIECNLFWQNGANQTDEYIQPPRFTIGVDGNLELEPKFVGNGDFHLQPGSPAIDSGCHEHAHEPDGTLPDRGAFGGPLAAWVDL